MEPRIMYAVEAGVASFVGSDDCSREVRAQIEREQTEGQFSGHHFHDLAAVFVATLSAFIAGVAANIASAYFQKKIRSSEHAEKVAEDAARSRRNEVRLRLGKIAVEGLTISDVEIRALGRHIQAACEKIKE